MRFAVRFLGGAFILILVICFAGSIMVEPWLKNHIKSTLKKSISQYDIDIEKVNVSFLNSSVELKSISINSRTDTSNFSHVKGDLISLKVNGINLVNVVFKKNVDISEIILSDGRIAGMITGAKKGTSAMVSPANIRVGKIVFDHFNMEITKDSSARKYEIKEGVLSVYDVQVFKKDTLSLHVVKAFDFKAAELHSVSTDSMYAYKTTNVKYSNAQKTLTLKDLTIHPNFSNYDFTARNKYQSDRISAEMTDLIIYDLDAADFLNAHMVSSLVRVGNLDMKIFSDKRRPFHHHIKSVFPELIYDAPGKLNIDSLVLRNGAITYTERAIGSLAEGIIRFSNIKASIYNISNNPMYKPKEDSLKIFVSALLMGKGPLTVVLKSKIFDRNNTVYVSGSLNGMDIQDFNPFLEKTEFLHINSGRINRLTFYFIADNYKATGHLILRYRGFAISHMKTKKGLKAALTGMVFNIITNAKLLNENPMPGKELRIGTIDYKRNPEKFVVNYLLKSVLSGIKNTILKNPKKKKKVPPDRITREL